MPSPRAVALLALAYRELSAPAERASDLSLGAKVAFEALENPTDDAIFEALERSDVLPQLLPELAEVSPVRAEALLHAFPPEDGPPSEVWADAFRARWQSVEQEIETLRALGIAAPPSAVDAVAKYAYAAAAGAGGG